jgi:predicted N-formylglutamate amidohydrolase
VPKSLGTLGLDEAELMRHIGWDIGAAEVARLLAEAIGAAAVLSGYSRLVADCNRRIDDPSCMPEESDGTKVPGNRGLSPEARAVRAAEIHEPYHAVIAERLAQFAARGIAPAIVSVHSFTPIMNGAKRPWHVGVLWGEDPRIAQPLIAHLGADPALVIGDNEPYSAREPIGLSMVRHAVPAGLPHVLLEIRQDLIDTRDGAQLWAARLADALRPILAEATLYRAERYG